MQSDGPAHKATSAPSDPVIVITGASRGLGAGMARAYQRRNARLGLCARKAPALTASERVVTETLDVRDGDAVQRFCDHVARRFGSIDLWINNAGVLDPVGPVRDLSAQSFMENLHINLVGVFHGTHAYIRHLHARRDTGKAVEGVLINISSGAARRGYAGWAAYSAAKAGVDRLTESVQLEEQHHGLRAYAVAPGVIDTDMQASVRRSDAARFPAVERFRELKRTNAFNSPDFVAQRIWEIAFDAARRPQDVVVRLPDEHTTPS